MYQKRLKITFKKQNYIFYGVKTFLLEFKQYIICLKTYDKHLKH